MDKLKYATEVANLLEALIHATRDLQKQQRDIQARLDRIERTIPGGRWLDSAEANNPGYGLRSDGDH